MTFTAEQVDAAFEAWSESEDFDGYGDVWLNYYYEEYDENDEVPGLGKIEVVARRSDAGDGQQIWVVIKVGDQLFRKTGYYSSWDSSSMDGITEEVEPYVEPVTFYRPKK